MQWIQDRIAEVPEGWPPEPAPEPSAIEQDIAPLDDAEIQLWRAMTYNGFLAYRHGKQLHERRQHILNGLFFLMLYERYPEYAKQGRFVIRRGASLEPRVFVEHAPRGSVLTRPVPIHVFLKAPSKT